MRITVNGKATEVAENSNLGAFVSAYKLEGKGVIAELNERVITKDLWVETVLKEGDRLELVSLVGGG